MCSLRSFLPMKISSQSGQPYFTCTSLWMFICNFNSFPESKTTWQSWQGNSIFLGWTSLMWFRISSLDRLSSPQSTQMYPGFLICMLLIWCCSSSFVAKLLSQIWHFTWHLSHRKWWIFWATQIKNNARQCTSQKCKHSTQQQLTTDASHSHWK